MTDYLAFLDTETLGLDKNKHPIWEVSITRCFWDEDEKDFRDVVNYDWFIRPTEEELDNADPEALRINRFQEVWNANHRYFTGWDGIIEHVHTALLGTTIVGAVPDFDTTRLQVVFDRYGMKTPWRYHLADVENLAAGHMKLLPPWDSRIISEALRVERDPRKAHGARYDVDWAMAVFKAVYSA